MDEEEMAVEVKMDELEAIVAGVVLEGVDEDVKAKVTVALEAAEVDVIAIGVVLESVDEEEMAVEVEMNEPELVVV